MAVKRTGSRLGSSFDSFLRERGLYESVSSLAWKRVLAWEITEAMRKADVSKTEMAKRMKTSRAQIDRLLDPDNVSVSLEAIQKAAAALGKRVVLNLEDAPELSGKAGSGPGVGLKSR